MFERWNARRETAKTQLRDLTMEQIYLLQTRLNAVLGNDEVSEARELLSFTVDPSEFTPMVVKAARLYSLGAKLDRFYIRGRRVASLVPRCLELTIILEILFFIRFGWNRHWAHWTSPWAWALLSAAGIVLLGSYLVYLYYDGRLQRAVMAAEER